MPSPPHPFASSLPKALPALLSALGLSMLAACAAEDPDDGSGACVVQTEPGATMRPGENCMRCHQPGFGPDEAPVFTAAGTIFESPESGRCDGVEGVKVILKGADGTDIELTTNAVGNFYTGEALMQPTPGPRIVFEDREISMASNLPPIAACNACHNVPPVGGAPGRIFIP